MKSHLNRTASLFAGLSSPTPTPLQASLVFSSRLLVAFFVVCLVFLKELMMVSAQHTRTRGAGFLAAHRWNPLPSYPWLQETQHSQNCKRLPCLCHIPKIAIAEGRGMLEAAEASVKKHLRNLEKVQGCIPTLTKLSQLREAAEVPDADYGPFGPSIHHYLFSSSCQAPATHANVAPLTQGIPKDADF